MLKSMTGFGKATRSADFGIFTAEIQTFNRKHLEIQLSLPPELFFLETDMRKWITQYVQRGRVNVKISINSMGKNGANIRANFDVAKRMKQASDELAPLLGISSSEKLILALLPQVKDLFIVGEEDKQEEYLKEVHPLLIEALEQLDQSRIGEGKLLHEEIQNRLNTLTIYLQDILNLAPKQKQHYRAKLETLFNEFVLGSSQDQDRIIQEVGLFAEKVDISEEISRVCFHQKKFLDQMELQENMGKNLDFLIQEMIRESNTIAAKSVDVEIIHRAIDMKIELERIREQIQNVE